MPCRIAALLLLASLLGACDTLGTAGDATLSCKPIHADFPWGALSGLTADESDPDILYAVHDHNLPDPEIYVLDISSSPALIKNRILLRRQGRSPDYDLEGVAQRTGGGFWLASEGKPGRGLPNLLVHVDDEGRVVDEVALPASMTPNKTKAGFEGIAVDGSGGEEQVVAVFQRSWRDDPEGLLKIARYRVRDKQWFFYHYPLDAKKGAGLSAITSLGNNRFLVLERDNRPFFKARIKRIYAITLPDHGATSSPLTVLNKALILDLLGVHNQLLCGASGKLEGMSSSKDGKLYLITDDDGKGNARLLEVPALPLIPGHVEIND